MLSRTEWYFSDTLVAMDIENYVLVYNKYIKFWP
jgi:hypothetical protein